MRVGSVLLILLAGPSVHATEICASAFSELERSPRLAEVKILFGADRQITAVNDSQGSYVVIDSLNDKFTISFFTSGLFDLYPIRKDGPLSFCEQDGKLRLIGLGLAEEFKIIEGKFQLGSGGPKKTFSDGPMPQALRKLHRMDARGIASKP